MTTDGVQKAVAELGTQQAINAGAEPHQAHTTAVAATTARYRALAVSCPWCHVPSASACVGRNGARLRKRPYHPARLEAADHPETQEQQ